ncbi:MAG TPA: flagellar basal body L-ring protein FlgH [Myxococcota bacterium]|nr:flagellar basal body L-ring protein FlgH [Myxococcota bacterium]
MLLLMLGAALAGPPEPPAPSGVAYVEPTELTADQIRRNLGVDYGTRELGSLVVVTIDEATSASLGATTNTSRASTADARITGFFGLVTQAISANPSMNFEDSIGLGGSSDADFAGAGDTARSSAIVAVVSCEVIEIAENGNLHVWGYKMITANNETEYLTVDGWVRPRDISIENAVASQRLARASIELKGDGVLDDKQSPGLGTRLMDHAWPF